MKRPKDVDEYIARVPENMRGRLAELRAVIKSTAPSADERISYGMPFYEYKGRLAYFQLRPTFIGLYIPPPVLPDHARELKRYKTTLSSLHLPLDEELPISLVRKLVKARMKVLDERAKKR